MINLKLNTIKLHYFKAGVASIKFFNSSHLKQKYHNQIITINRTEIVIYFIQGQLTIFTYGHQNKPPSWERHILVNSVDITWNQTATYYCGKSICPAT